jgi:5-deoxy-5-amino-3-dehydroquinate synthase
MITVPVELGDRRYPVLVGAGARHRLADVLPVGVRMVAVVTQANIGVEVDPGVPTVVLHVPDGEAAKSLASVEALCRGFARAGLSRRDAVVAVGGGVVTDLAGFAAASYQRGIAYVNVATTLLGQVDAAIGGKTGVNLPEGKNLVGAFWQPAAVICDTETLGTLPEREWASGRGEMAKYAFLPGPPAADASGTAASATGLPSTNASDAHTPGTGTLGTSDPSGRAGSSMVQRLLAMDLDHQVASCVAVKAAVVAADEREGDRRMILNYGHTLAHALEAAAFDGGAPWDLRHGEAVAIGLVFAAVLARRLGRIDDQRVAEHQTVVTHLGLPASLPDGVDPDVLLEFMARDKKADHDLTFVLDGPTGVEPVRHVPVDVVRAALADMAVLGAQP